ncbi:hypothetical protein AU476_15245 [Cupriavidus sp. UYMSc13B]|nr:hypothetical protein AU476_15245 [Cupriavidus sp. UYMSc13B]
MAGDLNWERKQIAAMRAYEAQLARLVKQLSEELPAFAAKFVDVDFGGIPLTKDQIIAKQAAGLHPNVKAALDKLGFTQEAEQQLDKQFRSQNPDDIYRVIRNQLNDTAISGPLLNLSQALAADAAVQLYNFAGFLSPIKNSPQMNRADAGAVIKMEFNIAGNKGINVIDPGFPVSQKINCDATDLKSLKLDPSVEKTLSQTNLKYNPTRGLYEYDWKTDSTWQNQCRLFTLRLMDGTLHYARFNFF